MQFNNTGTLINWQLDDINIVEPFHSKDNGSSRGGVYLCIPNFESLSPPFSIKHGEYRITACDTTLPHQKTLSAASENPWGEIEVSADWQEITEPDRKTLKVTASIRALSAVALVRPGFHPYFSIFENSYIALGSTHIDVAALPHDSMRAYQAASLSEEAKLTTANYTASVKCQISARSEDLAIGYAIWSDKKSAYVCIEPVIGGVLGADGLPTPLKLVKNEILELIFIIQVDKV